MFYLEEFPIGAYIHIFHMIPWSWLYFQNCGLGNQTSVDKDTKNPDSTISSLSGRTDRHQADTRQTMSGQNLDRQTADGLFGENLDTGKTPDSLFRRSPDRIRTKTRQGQDTDTPTRYGFCDTLFVSKRKCKLSSSDFDLNFSKWHYC